VPKAITLHSIRLWKLNKHASAHHNREVPREEFRKLKTGIEIYFSHYKFTFLIKIALLSPKTEIVTTAPHNQDGTG
jgi:hypothetical protein